MKNMKYSRLCEVNIEVHFKLFAVDNNMMMMTMMMLQMMMIIMYYYFMKAHARYKTSFI